MKASFVRLVLAAGLAALALLAGLSGGAQAAQATARTASSPVIFTLKCIGNSFCLGAGSYAKGKQFIPLNEEWTGKAWRIIPIPSGYQDDISCGGPTFCLASVAIPKRATREVVWNGRAWRRLSPQPPAFDIQCVSPAFCVTGASPGGQEGAYWNGKIWQRMPSAGGCEDADCRYDGVGCASATICWESGSYCTSSDCNDGIVYYSDTWNGTTWSRNSGVSLGRDACAGRAFCLSLHPTSALVTHDWGVTWQDATANLAAACHHLASCDSAGLATSCGSSRFCVALTSPDPSAALVWNGSKWGVLKLALVSGHLPKLDNLSCGGQRNCMATGTYQLNPRGAAHPVVEHWNGKTWKVTPIAKP